MNIDLGLSIAGPAFRFGPEFLFLSDEEGTATGNPFEAFTDTGGTTAADFGDAIARINDRSPNGRNALQSSSALRPLLGRAPVDVRNVWRHSENFGNALWRKSNISAAEVSGYWVLTAESGSGIAPYIDRRNETNEFRLPEFGPVINWVEVKAGTHSRVQLSLIDSNTASGANRAPAIFDLSSGVIIAQDAGAIIEPLDDGWFRIAVFRNTDSAEDRDRNFHFAIVAPNAVEPASSGSIFFSPSGSETVLIRRAQGEAGTQPTPYQRVGSGLDITEAGFPSPAFIRPDLSDDVLPTEFPDGFTGDVMVFGRKGSWIERGVEIASAGSLNIGPETFTGAPAGVLAALGDIVGWVAVERTLTDFEVARLVQYHRARGAKGLLVPGPEILPETGDPFTSTAGWDAIDATVAVDDGDLLLTADGGARSRLLFEHNFQSGQIYIAEASANSDISVSSGSDAAVIDIQEGAASTTVVATRLAIGAGALTPKKVFNAIDAQTFLRFTTGSGSTVLAGSTIRVHSASLRELRPQEDW